MGKSGEKKKSEKPWNKRGQGKKTEIVVHERYDLMAAVSRQRENSTNARLNENFR